MTRVAIIGGGIGGLTAANALSRAGAEVSVYEAAGELKEIGAGVALHPNAMRVLRFIGVEDGVRKVAGRSEYAVTRDGITARLISKTSRARFAEVQGIEPATVHRADLLDVLAAALPDGLVTLGKRCVAVDGDGDVAVARFADGTEAEADVIIGADGIHSAVRTGLFGPDAPRFTGKICYRSVIPTAAVRDGALSDVAAENGHSESSLVEHIHECNFSARTSALREIGGFNEEFQGNAYFEGADLALRLIEAGHKIEYHPEISLTHLQEGGGGNRVSEKARHTYWLMRNYGLLNSLHMSRAGLPVFGGYALGYVLAKAAKNADPAIAAEGLKGVAAGLRYFLPWAKRLRTRGHL